MFRFIKILSLLLLLLFIAGSTAIIIWAVDIATSYYVMPLELLWLIPFWLLFIPLYYGLEVMVHYWVNGAIISQFEILLEEERLVFELDKPTRPKFALWIGPFLSHVWNVFRFKKTGSLYHKSFPSLMGQLREHMVMINMSEAQTSIMVLQVQYGAETFVIKSKEISGWNTFKNDMRRRWSKKLPILRSPDPDHDFVFEERFDIQGERKMMGRLLTDDIRAILRESVWQRGKQVTLMLQDGNLIYAESGIVEDNEDRKRFKRVLLALGMIAGSL